MKNPDWTYEARVLVTRGLLWFLFTLTIITAIICPGDAQEMVASRPEVDYE